jgi:hypothetical protein
MHHFIGTERVEAMCMKKYGVSIVSILCVGLLNADIVFESEDARLTLSTGATLSYHPVLGDSFSKGIVRHNRAASFTGDGWDVDYLVVEESTGVYARFSNVTYDPTVTTEGLGTTPLITLNGGTIDGVNGFTLYEVAISGANNVLSGALKFSSPLTLAANTELTLALTTPLTANITLDNSTITLDADLVFKNCRFDGEGTIIGDSHLIQLDEHGIALASTLTWLNCYNIQLRGNAGLATDWRFEGQCRFDANGSWLDLREGGRIIIAPNTSLVLRDVVLKGVAGEDSLNIIFEEPEDEQEYGRLYLEGCRLEFASSVTFTHGFVEVLGDTMFVIKSRNVTFEDDAQLTIDGAVLSLNVLSNTTSPYTGTLYAPNPIYNNDHEKLVGNIAANIIAGNLVLNEGGIITEITGVTAVGSGGDGGSGGGEFAVDTGGFLPPESVLLYETDDEVDGGGSRILFARTSIPQFVITNDTTVRLSNVTLDGITAHTFSIGDDAVLEIGQNVEFILVDDITWSAEQIRLVGSGNTFKIKSVGPQRTLHFHSPGVGDPHDMSYSTHLAIGVNTLELYNVVLKGLRHITFASDDVVGDIVLAGNAVVETESDEYVCSHHFVVEGVQNSFRTRTDNMTFEGTISFDQASMSSVSFDFVLEEGLARVPVIHFGDDALNVSSESGVAYCSFNAPITEVSNHAASAFILGNNGYLKGNRVQVALNPIVQTSSRATIFPGMNIMSSLSGGAIILGDGLLAAMRGLSPRKVMTVRQALRREQSITRALSLPNESLKPVVHYDSALTLPDIAGNVMLRDLYGVTYTNWGISGEFPANLTLHDGVRVVQSALPTTLKEGDILNVVGGTVQQPNTIVITSDLSIDGSIMFGDNAVLCIEGASTGEPSLLTINEGSQLSFGSSSRLMIRGNVEVIFPAGYEIAYGDTGSTVSIGNHTVLRLYAEREVALSGAGTILCEDGGRIIIETGASLRIGTDVEDSLTLRVKTGGSVQVGDVLDLYDASSYLSFAGGHYALDCSQGGNLFIASNGVCECNLYQSVARAGVMNSIDFSVGGSLYIAENGLLHVSSNTGETGIGLVLHGATLRGSGFVKQAGTLFQGNLQSNLSSVTNATAAEVVRSLVQMNPVLYEATVYMERTQSKLRTKNGVLVDLSQNEIIGSDTESSGLVTGYNSRSGRRFSYNANGKLL